MTHPIEVHTIAKAFGKTRAVEDVSFSVEQGEIFGLLGPNGAGKTTTIRVLLDIFRPDHGSVSILDGPMSEEKKNRIGYMPEERGLYQQAPLERCLVYLGTLKGKSHGDVQKRVDDLIEQFDLDNHRKKKIKDLSKGMQQKAQIIATILHEPELIIIDEPFAALDPVNTRMVKDIMRDLSMQGTTILMSTHQMHQVEELCDRILLINKGRDILYGEIDEIRRRYSGRQVVVRTHASLTDLEGVETITKDNSETRITLSEALSPQDLLRSLVMQNIAIEKFEQALPTLDEIFIRAVKEEEA